MIEISMFHLFVLGFISAVFALCFYELSDKFWVKIIDRILFKFINKNDNSDNKEKYDKRK